MHLEVLSVVQLPAQAGQGYQLLLEDEGLLQGNGGQGCGCLPGCARCGLFSRGKRYATDPTSDSVHFRLSTQDGAKQATWALRTKPDGLAASVRVLQQKAPTPPPLPAPTFWPEDELIVKGLPEGYGRELGRVAELNRVKAALPPRGAGTASCHVTLAGTAHLAAPRSLLVAHAFWSQSCPGMLVLAAAHLPESDVCAPPPDSPARTSRSTPALDGQHPQLWQLGAEPAANWKWRWHVLALADGFTYVGPASALGGRGDSEAVPLDPQLQELQAVQLAWHPQGHALAVCATDAAGQSCVAVLSGSTLELLWHRRWEPEGGGTPAGTPHANAGSPRGAVQPGHGQAGCVCAMAWAPGLPLLLVMDDAGNLAVLDARGDAAGAALVCGAIKYGESPLVRLGPIMGKGTPPGAGREAANGRARGFDAVGLLAGRVRGSGSAQPKAGGGCGGGEPVYSLVFAPLGAEGLQGLAAEEQALPSTAPDSPATPGGAAAGQAGLSGSLRLGGLPPRPGLAALPLLAVCNGAAVALLRVRLRSPTSDAAASSGPTLLHYGTPRGKALAGLMTPRAGAGGSATGSPSAATGGPGDTPDRDAVPALPPTALRVDVQDAGSSIGSSAVSTPYMLGLQRHSYSFVGGGGGGGGGHTPLLSCRSNVSDAPHPAPSWPLVWRSVLSLPHPGQHPHAHHAHPHHHPYHPHHAHHAHVHAQSVAASSVAGGRNNTNACPSPTISLRHPSNATSYLDPPPSHAGPRGGILSAEHPFQDASSARDMDLAGLSAAIPGFGSTGTGPAAPGAGAGGPAGGSAGADGGAARAGGAPGLVCSSATALQAVQQGDVLVLKGAIMEALHHYPRAHIYGFLPAFLALVHLHRIDAAARLLRSYAAFTGQVAVAASSAAAAAARCRSADGAAGTAAGTHTQGPDPASAGAPEPGGGWQSAAALRAQWQGTMHRVLERELEGAGAGPGAADGAHCFRRTSLDGARVGGGAAGHLGGHPHGLERNSSPHVTLRLPMERFRGHGGKGQQGPAPGEEGAPVGGAAVVQDDGAGLAAAGGGGRERHVLGGRSSGAGGMAAAMATVQEEAALEDSGRQPAGPPSGQGSDAGAAARAAGSSGGGDAVLGPDGIELQVEEGHGRWSAAPAGTQPGDVLLRPSVFATADPAASGGTAAAAAPTPAAGGVGAGEAQEGSGAAGGPSHPAGPAAAAEALQDMLTACVQLLQLACQAMAFVAFSAHSAGRAAAAAAALESVTMPMSPSSPRSPAGGVLSRQAMRRLSSTMRMRSLKTRSASIFGTTAPGGHTGNTASGGAGAAALQPGADAGTASGGTASGGAPLPSSAAQTASGATASALRFGAVVSVRAASIAAGAAPPPLGLGTSGGAVEGSGPAPILVGPRPPPVPPLIVGFPIPVLGTHTPQSAQPGQGQGMGLVAQELLLGEGAGAAALLLQRTASAANTALNSPQAPQATPMRLELHHCAFDVTRLWQDASLEVVGPAQSSASLYLRPAYASGLLLMAHACAIQLELVCAGGGAAGGWASSSGAVGGAAGVEGEAAPGSQASVAQQQGAAAAKQKTHEQQQRQQQRSSRNMLRAGARNASARVNWQLLRTSAPSTSAAIVWQQLNDWHRAALLAFACANELTKLGGGSADLPVEQQTKRRKSTLEVPPAALDELVHTPGQQGAGGAAPEGARGGGSQESLAAARAACLLTGQRVLLNQVGACQKMEVQDACGALLELVALPRRLLGLTSTVHVSLLQKVATRIVDLLPKRVCITPLLPAGSVPPLLELSHAGIRQQLVAHTGGAVARVLEELRLAAACSGQFVSLRDTVQQIMEHSTVDSCLRMLLRWQGAYDGPRVDAALLRLPEVVQDMLLLPDTTDWNAEAVLPILQDALLSSGVVPVADATGIVRAAISYAASVEALSGPAGGRLLRPSEAAGILNSPASEKLPLPAGGGGAGGGGGGAAGAGGGAGGVLGEEQLQDLDELALLLDLHQLQQTLLAALQPFLHEAVPLLHRALPPPTPATSSTTATAAAAAASAVPGAHALGLGFGVSPSGAPPSHPNIAAMLTTATTGVHTAVSTPAAGAHGPLEADDEAEDAAVDAMLEDPSSISGLAPVALSAACVKLLLKLQWAMHCRAQVCAHMLRLVQLQAPPPPPPPPSPPAPTSAPETPQATAPLSQPLQPLPQPPAGAAVGLPLAVTSSPRSMSISTGNVSGGGHRSFRDYIQQSFSSSKAQRSAALAAAAAAAIAASEAEQRARQNQRKGQLQRQQSQQIAAAKTSPFLAKAAAQQAAAGLPLTPEICAVQAALMAWTAALVRADVFHSGSDLQACVLTVLTMIGGGCPVDLAAALDRALRHRSLFNARLAEHINRLKRTAPSTTAAPTPAAPTPATATGTAAAGSGGFAAAVAGAGNAEAAALGPHAPPSLSSTALPSPAEHQAGVASSAGAKDVPAAPGDGPRLPPARPTIQPPSTPSTPYTPAPSCVADPAALLHVQYAVAAAQLQVRSSSLALLGYYADPSGALPSGLSNTVALAAAAVAAAGAAAVGVGGYTPGASAALREVPEEGGEEGAGGEVLQGQHAQQRLGSGAAHAGGRRQDLAMSRSTPHSTLLQCLVCELLRTAHSVAASVSWKATLEGGRGLAGCFVHPALHGSNLPLPSGAAQRAATTGGGGAGAALGLGHAAAGSRVHSSVGGGAGEDRDKDGGEKGERVSWGMGGAGAGGMPGAEHAQWLLLSLLDVKQWAALTTPPPSVVPSTGQVPLPPLPRAPARSMPGGYPPPLPSTHAPGAVARAAPGSPPPPPAADAAAGASAASQPPVAAVAPAPAGPGEAPWRQHDPQALRLLAPQRRSVDTPNSSGGGARPGSSGAVLPPSGRAPPRTNSCHTLPESPGNATGRLSISALTDADPDVESYPHAGGQSSHHHTSGGGGLTPGVSGSGLSHVAGVADAYSADGPFAASLSMRQHLNPAFGLHSPTPSNLSEFCWERDDDPSELPSPRRATGSARSTPRGAQLGASAGGAPGGMAGGGAPGAAGMGAGSTQEPQAAPQRHRMAQLVLGGGGGTAVSGGDAAGPEGAARGVAAGGMGAWGGPALESGGQAAGAVRHSGEGEGEEDDAHSLRVRGGAAAALVLSPTGDAGPSGAPVGAAGAEGGGEGAAARGKAGAAAPAAASSGALPSRDSAFLSAESAALAAGSLAPGAASARADPDDRQPHPGVEGPHSLARSHLDTAASLHSDAGADMPTLNYMLDMAEVRAAVQLARATPGTSSPARHHAPSGAGAGVGAGLEAAGKASGSAAGRSSGDGSQAATAPAAPSAAPAPHAGVQGGAGAAGEEAAGLWEALEAAARAGGAVRSSASESGSAAANGDVGAVRRDGSVHSLRAGWLGGHSQDAAGVAAARAGEAGEAGAEQLQAHAREAQGVPAGPDAWASFRTPEAGAGGGVGAAVEVVGQPLAGVGAGVGAGAGASQGHGAAPHPPALPQEHPSFRHHLVPSRASDSGEAAAQPAAARAAAPEGAAHGSSSAAAHGPAAGPESPAASRGLPAATADPPSTPAVSSTAAGAGPGSVASSLTFAHLRTPDTAASSIHLSDFLRVPSDSPSASHNPSPAHLHPRAAGARPAAPTAAAGAAAAASPSAAAPHAAAPSAGRHSQPGIPRPAGRIPATPAAGDAQHGTAPRLSAAGSGPGSPPLPARRVVSASNSAAHSAATSHDGGHGGGRPPAGSAGAAAARIAAAPAGGGGAVRRIPLPQQRSSANGATPAAGPQGRIAAGPAGGAAAAAAGGAEGDAWRAPAAGGSPRRVGSATADSGARPAAGALRGGSVHSSADSGGRTLGAAGYGGGGSVGGVRGERGGEGAGADAGPGSGGKRAAKAASFQHHHTRGGVGGTAPSSRPQWH